MSGLAIIDRHSADEKSTLAGWVGEVLCFVEVKTRTSREVKPAEAAVDREKRRELAGMAREYLRRLPDGLPCVLTW